MDAETIAVIGYGAGAAVSWRPIFRWWLEIDNAWDPKLTWGDIYFGAVLTTLYCTAWWTYWLVRSVRARATNWTPEQAAKRIGGQTRESKLAEREKRVARLERELGVDA